MTERDSFLYYKDPWEVLRDKLLDQQFLTISEATSVLEVSRWTVMRWITEGKLSGQKVGRAKLIPTGQVKRLLTNKGEQKRPQFGRFSVMSPAQVREVAKVLAEVLKEGYMPVSPEDLAEVIRGEEHAGPVFWSALVAGIERIKWKGRPQLAPMTAHLDDSRHAKSK